MSEDPKFRISGFVPESAMKFFEEVTIPGAEIMLTPIPEAAPEGTGAGEV